MSNGYALTDIPFDLDLELTQRAPIERDEGTYDKFGGEAKRDRVVIDTLKCRFYWWRQGSGRSAVKEWADPEATLYYTGGGMIVPPDSNVREGDRVKDVQTVQGEVFVRGPFRVVGIGQWEDHWDVLLIRP